MEPTPSLALASRLEGELRDVAQVEVDRTSWGIAVCIRPRRAGARALWWADFGTQIILEIGELGGRFELGAAAPDVAFLEDVVRSVIAGRVREVLAWHRSRVIVVLEDGTTEVETGYEALAGCLPLPLWPRWARKIQYVPYA